MCCGLCFVFDPWLYSWSCFLPLFSSSLFDRISTISALHWYFRPSLSLTCQWSLLFKQTSAPRRRPMSPVSLMNLDWCCPQFVPDLRLQKLQGDSLTNWVLIQIVNGSCHSEQADGQMECHGSQYVQDIIKSKVKHVFQCCSWCLLCVLIKVCHQLEYN